MRCLDRETYLRAAISLFDWFDGKIVDANQFEILHYFSFLYSQISFMQVLWYGAKCSNNNWYKRKLITYNLRDLVSF